MTSLSDPSLQTGEYWYSLTLDADSVDEEEHQRLRLMFEYSYLSANKPNDMTLWFVALDDGGADIYISPHSILNPGFVRRYTPIICAPPSKHLLWMAGDHTSYESARGR